MSKRQNRSFAFLFEVGKWGIVVWLLWPLLTFQAEKMSLWRLLLGIALAVIYIGKLFYDVLLDNFRQRKEQYTFKDLLTLIGFIVLIAILIGGAVLIIGFFVMTQLQENSGTL
jgi:hypothetical protein